MCRKLSLSPTCTDCESLRSIVLHHGPALPADPESCWPGRQGLVAAGLSVSEPLLAGVEPSAADQATIITISRPPSLKVKLLI
jgi:hypothetical protein